MNQHEWRTVAGLHGHHRAMVELGWFGHDYPAAGLRKTRARPGTVGSSTIG